MYRIIDSQQTAPGTLLYNSCAVLERIMKVSCKEVALQDRVADFLVERHQV